METQTTVRRVKCRTVQHNYGRTGGWSTEMEASLTKLLGAKCAEVLRKMQKSVISSSLHIERTLKVAIYIDRIVISK